MADKVHREMPVGGKRARMGTGRGRGERLSIRLSATDAALLRALAKDYDVTFTAILERGIRLVAAESPPLRPRPSVVEEQGPDQ